MTYLLMLTPIFGLTFLLLVGAAFLLSLVGSLKNEAFGAQPIRHDVFDGPPSNR